jgi:hypothetical protein
MTGRHRLPSLVLFCLVALFLVACGAAGSPSVSPPAAPSASTDPGGAGTAPGRVDPNAPVGIDVPPGGGNGGFDPTAGRIVVPKPGQLDIRPISAQALTASVTGRRVVVSVAYASGVEPCSVLDSIVVTTGPGTFAITLREGHGPGAEVCIDLAEFKRAIVDLGDLAPGTYTISDGTGGAAPITLTVA